jgi:hypothetical protein
MKKDGSKDKLTITEEQFAQVWPNILKRKRKGCDFLDEKTGNFVEVKSGVLRPEQISEMTAQFAAGKSPVLGVVNHHSVLVFAEQMSQEQKMECVQLLARAHGTSVEEFLRIEEKLPTIESEN